MNAHYSPPEEGLQGEYVANENILRNLIAGVTLM